MCLPSLGQAHEFWIEPLAYQGQIGEPISANLKVGQHFKGDSYPYIPDNTQSFAIRIGDETHNLEARIGDIPAVRVTPFANGLAILSHVTSIFFLEYREAGKFAAFLEAEGQDGVLEQHRRQGLPMVGVKEAYQRFAKSLVQIGTQPGADRLLGLEFEWLLESDPYQSSGPLQARLFWKGAPLADAQIRQFTRYRGQVNETVLRTDAQGRVYLNANPGSEVLLNAVRMTPPSPGLLAARGVSWKSHWASVTFAVAPAN